MRNPIELTAAEIRAFGQAAVEALIDYCEELPSMRIMPDTTARDIRASLDGALPELGTDLDQLLSTWRNGIVPLSRHNGHPRFFGYVTSPGSAVTAIGDLLTSTLNANVTCWRSEPAPTVIEHIAIDWLKRLFGYPPESMGLFVSGGSMANFAALSAARANAAPLSVQRGMRDQRRLRVYVSEEAHFSSRKAAAMMGIGYENVITVNVDARFRMDVGDLRRRVESDLAAGFLPMCVVASAGTTNTGAFDPLDEVASFAREHRIWLHVDAAYGGFAILAPSARNLFRGIELADSIALDPHKWLYTSVGCGCVLYRDAVAARAAFAQDAEYTRAVGMADDEAFAFWDYGPELSRPFRALNVWLRIKHAGTAALGDAIEQNIQCAKYFAELIEADNGFEMLAPVELSVFCFRYAPHEFSGDLDSLNERILIELNRRGNSYLSNARLRGRFALRGCVLNYRTARHDMELLLDDVRRVGREVAAASY